MGKEAIGKFLVKLNTYKATADVEEGLKMYHHYSAVSDELLALRQVHRLLVLRPGSHATGADRDEGWAGCAGQEAAAQALCAVQHSPRKRRQGFSARV